MLFSLQKVSLQKKPGITITVQGLNIHLLQNLLNAVILMTLLNVIVPVTWKTARKLGQKKIQMAAGENIQ